jgi:hypothetical protein
MRSIAVDFLSLNAAEKATYMEEVFKGRKSGVVYIRQENGKVILLERSDNSRFESSQIANDDSEGLSLERAQSRVVVRLSRLDQLINDTLNID